MNGMAAMISSRLKYNLVNQKVKIRERLSKREKDPEKDYMNYTVK